MSVRIACPMCGAEYDPTGNVVCQGCPLQRGCGMVRCPSCGFETPDLRQSKTASWAARWFKERKPKSERPDLIEKRIG